MVPIAVHCCWISEQALVYLPGIASCRKGFTVMGCGVGHVQPRARLVQGLRMPKQL